MTLKSHVTYFCSKSNLSATYRIKNMFFLLGRQGVIRIPFLVKAAQGRVACVSSGTASQDIVAGCDQFFGVLMRDDNG